MSFHDVPTLNIADLQAAPSVFVEKFGAAYQEWGFAGITGHGIDSEIIERAMRQAELFFGLPLEQKSQYQQNSSWARGYVPFGVEKAKNAEHSDLKEFYHLGREGQKSPYVGENVWPDNEDFMSAFTDLHHALDQLSIKILSAAALYLGLPDTYFTQPVIDGEALLRVLHYPPILDQDIPNERAAAHEDINLITLLVGSEQEGLEVMSQRGDWVPISMLEGTIICNVGDMMQRLSNGKLRSTTHRVVNPQGDKARQSRYSMPFFVHPEPSMTLACLPQCCTAEHPKQFDDILAGDYHRQRLQEIGFAK